MEKASAFLNAIEATEDRYQASRDTREAREESLSRGGLLEANDRGDLVKRLERLQVDPGTVRAIVEEETPFAILPPAGAREGAVALERLIGSNDLMDVRFLGQGAQAARAVGRVHVRTPAGRRIGFGTGFLVSPRLLLTNNHVLGSRSEAAPSRIELGYQLDPHGQATPSETFGLDPETFFLTDPTLDYTLVAVRARPALEPFGWLRLIEEGGKALVGERVNIIQHPNGEPKQLALRENRIIVELEEFLHYHTDTAPGSSGSPVFNDQWEVIALHHSGVPKRDEQNRILTRDGEVWERTMGEHRIAWLANEGARISRILRHIRQQRLDAGQRPLLAALFEALPIPPVDTGATFLRPPQPATPPAPSPLTSPRVAPDGSVTWDIPLSLTIQVGGQTAPAPAPATPEPASPPPMVAEPTPSGALDSETLAALEELAEARTRVYYDAAADQTDAAAYYGGIDPLATAEVLFQDLSALVKATHTESFKYNPRRHVYPWVDLHPDLMLRSIYSGQVFDPEVLIREDFRVEEERAGALNELLLREGSLGTSRMQEELSLLESRLPFNCEHVVPQSWFQEKEPMRGDLHHLFACESGCNSFRSNLPYFDFPDFMEAERDQCGKRTGDDKFEPEHGKGTVARAALYFLLRYPGQVGDEADEMQRDRIATLVKWHKDFPPQEYERHRNAAIAAMQGNRNPLIDHPEWGERVAFGLGIP